MDEPRVWVAPLGSVIDDGLTIIDDLPPAGPPIRWPVTITLTAVSPALGWWRLYRDVFGITHPDASRVKRAYHQRRR